MGGMQTLTLPHGRLDFPVFLPDATFGYVRTSDSADLEACRIQAVVMNTFHLMQKPGASVVKALGGLHRMAGWRRPIITDSGGFQAYSLIHQNPRFGTLSDHGIHFQPEGAERKFQLTPEKSVEMQVRFGADVVISLDDCTHVDATLDEQRVSVRRTVEWARRGKVEFEKLTRGLDPEKRPLLFAVVQGGSHEALRRECAGRLLEIGFDGYGYGGWPLDRQGNFLAEIVEMTRRLIPDEYPMHALGIGHPENVVRCHAMGYGIFDCAMPTRDARHGRLYRFNEPGGPLSGQWYSFVYIEDERHVRADRPVSPDCDCPVCERYSIGYLRHLNQMGDSLYLRLATLHNLRFMTRLTERLREPAT